ncbi:MAG: sterol desaturase family protein [Bacteroidetes bacterium]|nr:sterol desaturase family protein [Bacteroidota bacterium]
MNKLFVSDSQDSSRMFKSNWMEALSKVHYSIPLIIFIPVIGYFLTIAILSPTFGIATFFVSLGSGLLVWTLTEYVMHRFIFHFVPKSAWGLRLHFIFHGVHHDYPNDRLRLVLPPSVSIPLATGFYFLFKSVLPASWLPSFFAAFLTGYLIYDMVHYAIHHFNSQNLFIKKLKQHHMRHHYTAPDKGFGVSSALWDKILNTDFKK